MAPNRASDHATQYRTHSCGELRAEHAPKPGERPAPPPIADELDVLVPRKAAAAGAFIVSLSGYVDERVDEYSFLLRDHYGTYVASLTCFAALSFLSVAFALLVRAPRTPATPEPSRL